MSNYLAYYNRAISEHQTGLKLVLGGTGLGKTSAIKQVVTAEEHVDRKFIYCTNRKQLIGEMAQYFDPKKYVILPRDLDAVLSTLKDYRTPFYDLLEDSNFRNNLKRWNDKSKLNRIDIPTVRRACQTLEEILAQDISIPKILEEQMDQHARIVLTAFKSVLLASNNKRGDSPSFLKLVDNPVIQSLFPYLKFKRHSEVRIMLITLQKAFYGFFDGFKTVNLTSLQDKDGGYIIFLDEFDFLENDLVELICRAPQISNPFRFVGLFYDAMAHHKLPLETYPLSANIRKRIEDIKDLIEILRLEGLPFPDINQFTSTIPQKRAGHAAKGSEETKFTSTIFRTRHILNTEPLYLHLTNRSFELVSEADTPGTHTYSALHLFDIVSKASEQILLLFKELEKFDEIIHKEMLRHCFQDTVFPEQMALVSQFSRAPRDQSTQIGTLLDRGYSLYDIDDLQQRTDRDEVDVRHYGMSSTPEMILRSMVQHNLVFGLSATADLKRHIHNFNLDWLGQQVNVIPIDENDLDIIRALNHEKSAKRDNKIEVFVLGELSQQDQYQHRLNLFLSTVSANDEDFGQETKSGHLKHRVQLFFAYILWACEHHTENSTHLIFLNTFRQTKLVFERYHTNNDGLFAVAKRESNAWFDVYTLTIKGKEFNVVFYNAQIAKVMYHNVQAQKLFDSLFWEGRPVVVVTQYLSAGNGVNLQYRPSSDSTIQQDFTHIGLLEAPYFYFSKPDPELTWEERITALKENIWYQAKLFAGKAISEKRFRKVLSTLHASSEWNMRYQTDLSTAADALFNHMSAFMQALGRIERVWEKMADQSVLMSREVYHRFQVFCSPEYEEIRAQREPIISSNLRQIFTQISERLPQAERDVRRFKDARLEAKNRLCQESIQQLLQRLEKLRQGNGDRDARKQWELLRKAALKHDFSHEIFRDYSCVFESPYYTNGILYLTSHNEIIPARIALPDALRWRMDAAYDVIEGNRVIRDYFIAQGYELSFQSESRQFFTPYVYQAILLGAIGEEAVASILDDEDIKLDNVPDTLFEVADLKIKNQSWYIDCKNYNELTLEKFTLTPDDPARRPKLNEAHFKQNASAKLQKINAFHGRGGKLIYINLVSSQERPLDYYDCSFNPSPSFEDAEIVVIQGALQRSTPNAYQQAFEYFLQDIKRSIEERYDNTNSTDNNNFSDASDFI